MIRTPTPTRCAVCKKGPSAGIALSCVSWGFKVIRSPERDVQIWDVKKVEPKWPTDNFMDAFDKYNEIASSPRNPFHVADIELKRPPDE